MTVKSFTRAALVFLMLLLMAEACFADVSYYGWVWSDNPQIRPGETVNLKIRLDAHGTKYSNEKVKYTLLIYRLDKDKIAELQDEKASIFTLVASETRKIELKGSRGRWLTAEDTYSAVMKEPGLYRVALKFGKHHSRAFFGVTSLGAIAKSTSDKSTVFVSDTKTGEPLKDVSVFALMPKSPLVKIGMTDENGLFEVSQSQLPAEAQKRGNCAFLVEKDGDYATAELVRPWEGVRLKAYIYSDRPVYRPGQKVYFKGVLRYDEKGSLTPLSNEPVKVEIADSRGNKLLEQEMTANSFGSIDGHIVLAEEPPLGQYVIRVYYKGHSALGTFKVEEYRKPEFLVNLSPKSRYIVGGEKAEFEGEAKYYFGAPVAGNGYTYTVTKRNYSPHVYRYWWQDYVPWYAASHHVTSGSGTTDDKGRFAIGFDTKKEIFDSTYSVTVRLNDESRRVIEGSGSVIATVGRFNIQLKADRYFYSPSSAVNVRVTVKDYDGNPVSTDVKMSVSRALWERGKRISENSFYNRTVSTGKNGEAVFSFVPDRVGYFTVNAVAADENNNSVIAATSFYSAESGGDWYRSEALELKPDKVFYDYNEEIGLMVSNPLGRTKALLTVEGEEIYEKRIVEINSPVDIIKLKALPAYSPNVNVTLSFWKDGKVYKATAGVVVPASDKIINLSVKRDKESYGPRQTANFRIKALKNDGSPVSCEVCVGVADESVYAISEDKTPHIQKFFWANRRIRVNTADSFIQRIDDYGTSELDMAVPAPSTGAARKKNGLSREEGAGDMVEPDFVRDYFPDTCYFNATIITDHKGEAAVPVLLPDSLTTWRFTGRAASLMSEVGQTVEKFIVKKDLLVRLILPRFLTEGDTTTVSAIVHNYLDGPVESRVSLKVQGAVLQDKDTVTVSIGKNGKATVHWKVRADKSGQAKFTVTALTKKESDAMSLPIPVHPRGVKVVKAEAQSGENEFVLSLNMPDNAPLHSAGLQVVISPSLAGTLIPAIEYLAGYPYGCTEQTMSRFIPNAVVQASLKEFGIKNPKLEEELPKMMKKGFEKLYDYHHSDGGWGWWKNDSSHPHMTAYVVYGLSLAKKSGFTVDETVLAKGVKWLKDNYAATKEVDTRAYMLFALSQSGNHQKEWLSNLFDSHQKLNNYSRAILAISLFEAGQKTHASTVIKSLDKSAVVQNTRVYWKSGNDRSWSDNTVETTAYVIKAYILIEPESPLLEKAVRYVTASRQGKSWYSTKDTAAAVLALIDYVKLTGETNAEFAATVSLNGREIKTAAFTKADIATGGVTVNIPGSAIKRGQNRILFQKKGPGRLYGMARLTFYTEESPVKAADNGIKVTRQYFRVIKGGKDPQKEASEKGRNRRISPDGENELAAGETAVPVDISEAVELTAQDEVIVKITLEGDINSQYLMLEDYKPAGLEAVEKKPVGGYWNRWYAQKEFRDEKVVFFATNFYKGKQTLTYRMRAETPGTYRAMPANASLMYVPDVGGYSGEAMFVVLP